MFGYTWRRFSPSSRPLLGLSAFAIIVAHEIGHAVIARGARYEVVSIDVALLRGECRYRGKITPRAESVIAWGGVLAQLVLALIALSIRWVDKDIPDTAPAISPSCGSGRTSCSAPSI